MTGSTIIIQLHGYRGFAYDGGGLLTWLTVGFITVAWCPILLGDWLRATIKTIRDVAKSENSRGFVEMAAWDESRTERTNVSVFQKFPNGIHKRPQ